MTVQYIVKSKQNTYSTVRMAPRYASERHEAIQIPLACASLRCPLLRSAQELFEGTRLGKNSWKTKPLAACCARNVAFPCLGDMAIALGLISLHRLRRGAVAIFGRDGKPFDLVLGFFS